MTKQILRDAAITHRECIMPPYNKFIGTDGFEAIYLFSETFSGTNIYVPSPRTIFKECIERRIVDNYNGSNIKKLACKYGFSERFIRGLLLSAGKL